VRRTLAHAAWSGQTLRAPCLSADVVLMSDDALCVVCRPYWYAAKLGSSTCSIVWVAKQPLTGVYVTASCMSCLL
jgi:hypothetical protein